MESKRCRIRRVKNWRIALATLTSLVFRGLATLSVVFLGLPNVAIAREIQGQVVIVTKDGKSVKLVSVEVFAYNRSDVEKAIKQVDEKLKARREKVRSGNDIDNLVKKASDARKEAHEKELQHPEDESLRLASEQASNLEKDVLEFVALARRRRNYLLSSQPYFAALPAPVARAKTDADGNFALDLPPVGSFVIGARTQRSVQDSIEHYAWIVTIDHAGSQKLVLSNGNVTSAGGEHSLLKTEGNENDAEDSSREQAEVLQDKIVREIAQRDAQTRSEATAVPSQPGDFTTTNGKEYKNADVIRVDPDGIVIRTKSAILKVYWWELPKDVADKWLAPIRAAERAAEENRIKEQQAAEEKRAAAERERTAAERERTEKENKADAELKRAIEQFQAAEQRAAQSYKSATKGTLSGQVFVSTRGGENFKLGGVPVVLFERDAIDALIAAEKIYAGIKIEQLGHSLDAAKAASDQAGAAEEYYSNAYIQSRYDDPNRETLKQWDEQTRGAADRAREEYERIRESRDFYYSGAFYFGPILNPIQTAETDADGKFAIEVPKTGAFVIAAKAERSVGEYTERYYWLQGASLDGQQQRVQNLSNNNLTRTTGTSALILTQD